MKKTMNGKTYNTDSGIERGVSVKKVEVSNGIKTLVLERVYESKTGDDWFIVTTTTKYKTNNDYDHLSYDDVFIGCEKSLSPMTKVRMNII